MAAGTKIQHKRRAGPPVDGELAAGEEFLDVSSGLWWFSRNGTTVEQQQSSNPGGGATSLNDLTDVQIAALANGHVLYWNGSQFVNAAPVTAGLVPTSQKGAADGLATLGSDGKIPAAQLPALALTEVYVVANTTARNALTVQAGDVAVVTGPPAESYIYDGSAWIEYRVTEAHTHDAADITSGTIAAARLQGSIVAALNAATGTISNPNLVIDGGTI